MGRTTKGPGYIADKHGYFAIFNKRRIRLTTGPEGKEELKQAWAKWNAENQARMVETAGDRNTLFAVLNARVQCLQNRVKNHDMAPNTLKIHLGIILPLNQRCGSITIRDFKPQHLDDFIVAMRQPRRNEKINRTFKWGDGTAVQCHGVVQSAFIWAVEEAGLITRNPLSVPGKKSKKRHRRRPSENRTAILDGEHALLLEQANTRTKKDFFHLLTFMYRTGARPAELHGATGEEWNDSLNAFVIPGTPASMGRFKLAHLGEERTVYIPTDLVPLAKELMEKERVRAEKKGELPGPIFRTGSGRVWQENTLAARFICSKKAVNKKAGRHVIRKEVTAYSYRHAYITQYLGKGRDIDQLAERLNTSVDMIRKTYSHLFRQHNKLRESMDEFDRERVAQPSTQKA